MEISFVGIKKRRKVHWPEPEDLGRLVTLATNPSPLFIYAATLCRYVDNGRERTNPVRRLKHWLEKSNSNTSEFNEQLNGMYNTVPDEVWSSTGLDSDEKHLLWEILRSIVRATESVGE